MSTKIPLGIYKNHQNVRVDVIGVSRLVEHESQGLELVIYRVIDETREMRACPVETFTEIVGVDENGKDVARFEMISSNATGLL